MRPGGRDRFGKKVVIGKAENEVWKLRNTDLPTCLNLAPEGEI